MAKYINIWKDDKGREYAGVSIFSEWDDVVSDVREWQSKTNQYLYTVSNVGQTQVTENDIAEQERSEAEDAKHRASVGAWANGSRDTNY